MRTLALCAWILLLGPRVTTAFTIPLAPKLKTPPAPAKSSEWQQCNEWVAIVRDIASARMRGEPMASYIADLQKTGEDPASPEIQLIQRIYQSNLSPDDAAAAWQKECYATMQQHDGS